jgi:EmrB/QacA subfamily drug resistance transporter
MSTLVSTPTTWRRWLALPVLSLAVGMVGIDISIVSVANVTIGRDLHASLGALQWVTNAYLLALCTLILNAGRLGDRLGRRRVFIAGVVGFGLASGGCALASTIAELIAWRTAQGAAGAMLMPTTVALVQSSFSGKDLDAAIGVWAATSLGSIVVGPILGGLLVERVSWQSVFLINAPIAALAVVGALWFVTESRDTEAGTSFDLAGTVLGGAGLCVLVFAVIKAQSHGWGSTSTLVELVVAAALLAAFAAREATASDPMVPLELFRAPAVAAATALAVVIYFAFYGGLFFWTLYLQRCLGDSPLTSGIQLIPLTLGFLAAVPLAGWVGGRLGLRVSMLFGLLGLVVTSALMTRIRLESGYAGVWPYFLLFGASIAFAAVSGIEAILSNAPLRYAGAAGSVVTTASQLGGVLGIAVLGSVLASHAGTSLVHALVSEGLDPRLAARLAAHAATGSTGPPAQLLPQLPHPIALRLAHGLTRAGDRAFLDGLHVAMLVAGGAALAGTLIAPRIKRGHAASGVRHVV